MGAVGLFVNGVSIYGISDGMSYGNQKVWLNAAPVFEQYDMDICTGHAAQGDYHHHHNPNCLSDRLGDNGTAHSPLYGWVMDGFPLYGPYSATNTLAQSCWKKRDYNDPIVGCADGGRSCVLVDEFAASKGTTSASSSGPSLSGNITTQSGNSVPAVSGIYYQDYYYDSTCTAGGGLDRHNGHSHDGLSYHYHITMGSNGEPAFPYMMGPTYYGALPAGKRCASSISG